MQFMKSNTSIAKKGQYSTDDLNLRLYQAASCGDLTEVQKILCEHKNELTINYVNPDTCHPYSGRTTLHQAIFNKHWQVAAELVYAGWSILIKDTHGQTPYSMISDEDKNQREVINGLYLADRLSSQLVIIFDAINLKRTDNFSANKPLRILSLACGLSVEPKALQDYFSENEVNFFGVDNDEEILAASRMVNQKISNTNFICTDATDIDLLQNHLGKELFDLVILRHPDILYNRNIFAWIVRYIPIAIVDARIAEINREMW